MTLEMYFVKVIKKIIGRQGRQQQEYAHKTGSTVKYLKYIISIILLQVVWLPPLATGRTGTVHSTSRSSYTERSVVGWKRSAVVNYSNTNYNHTLLTTLSTTHRPNVPWIELVHQTDWVTPNSSFNLLLSVNPHQFRQSQLKLSITLFRRLRSRSAFQLTIHNQYPTPVLQQLPAIPLSSISPAALHDIKINFPVVTSSSTSSSTEISPTTHIVLDCSPGNCGGVYPVRIELINTTTNHRISEITTHLIYTNPPPSSLKLRFAMIMGAQPALLPSRASIKSIDQQLTTLVNSLLPYKNISMDITPFVNSITDSDAEAVNPSKSISTNNTNTATTPTTPYTETANYLVHKLSTILANDPKIELPMLPYSSINPSALYASNLQSNIIEQLHQGTQLIGSILGPSVEKTHLWIATEPLTKGALQTLHRLGIDQLVVPEDNLAPIPTLLTPTQPFTITLNNRIKFHALIANYALAEHFINGPNVTLGIHQLLADLSQIYYDEPNFQWPRAVVVEVPPTWKLNSSSLYTLFHALTDSPIIQTATASNIFSTVPSGVGGEPSSRRLATHIYTGKPLPTDQIVHLENEINSLQQAVPPNTPSVSYINRELLNAEASQLSKAQQQEWLSAVQQSINTQIHYISTPPGRDITLTSRQARIPITILSHAPYPLSAMITLKSDKLIFPHGSTQHVTLPTGNTTIYFSVIARTSGDFPLHLLLQSPKGNLIFLNTNFTVHSMAISAVALVLTIGAILFLLLWWLRTVWRPTARIRNSHTKHNSQP